MLFYMLEILMSLLKLQRKPNLKVNQQYLQNVNLLASNRTVPAFNVELTVYLLWIILAESCVSSWGSRESHNIQLMSKRPWISPNKILSIYKVSLYNFFLNLVASYGLMTVRSKNSKRLRRIKITLLKQPNITIYVTPKNKNITKQS